MKPYRTIFRIGNVCNTRFWFSIESKPYRRGFWHLSFGRTYNGTYAGMVLCTPWFSILSHLRDLDPKHYQGK